MEKRPQKSPFVNKCPRQGRGYGSTNGEKSSTFGAPISPPQCCKPMQQVVWTGATLRGSREWFEETLVEGSEPSYGKSSLLGDQPGLPSLFQFWPRSPTLPKTQSPEVCPLRWVTGNFLSPAWVSSSPKPSYSHKSRGR